MRIIKPKVHGVLLTCGLVTTKSFINVSDTEILFILYEAENDPVPWRYASPFAACRHLTRIIRPKVHGVLLTCGLVTTKSFINVSDTEILFILYEAENDPVP